VTQKSCPCENPTLVFICSFFLKRRKRRKLKLGFRWRYSYFGHSMIPTRQASTNSLHVKFKLQKKQAFSSSPDCAPASFKHTCRIKGEFMYACMRFESPTSRSFSTASARIRATSFGLLLMHKLAYGKWWEETVVGRSY
jgi:hypothetical protein